MEVYRPGRRDPGADALGKTDQKLHPIVFILGSAAAGILFGALGI